MIDVNKIIDEILLEHSQKYPIPSLKEKVQVENLIECCYKLGYGRYAGIISEIFINEAEPPKKPQSDGEGESKDFPGKFHLGGGYYSSKEGGEVEFKNDNGNLRPVTPEEKAEFEKKLGGGDEKEPTDSKQPTEQPPAEKSPEEKEKEDAIKNEPEKVLNNPDASARDRARAGSSKRKRDILKAKQKDDPEFQAELKKKVTEKNEEIAKELTSQKDSDGNMLDAETTENGSLLIGVEHGEGNESTKNTIEKIKSLPKDAKVMFVGEGGVGLGDDGKIDFVGEQAELRDACLEHFDNAKEESWDENGDVRNSDSPIFDDIAKSFDGNKEKAMASVWTNMVGQGDDLDADDYLTDETKEWIKGEARKGGSKEFDGDVDWNNLTLEQKEDLYQLNYRDDQNYGETDLSKGQKAFNDYRQKELDRKIKEGEEKGYTVIATMGNSHVGMWRERNKKKDETFKPQSLRNLQKELPDADKEVFSKESDLDKIPADKREEISMKIDELADKANKGEDFNLCQVTVPGTNLYCDDNQGIPREEMPQFKGKPLPGTPAEELPKDSKGEVDTEPLFKKMLKEKGIKTVETELPSDKLKATQSELVGSKVAGMTKALEEDPQNPGITAPIYVSRDGFVIDGHHRWAAVTSAAIKAGKPANMKVIVVDMDIKDAIPMCNQFAEEQGIAAKKADANDGEQPKPKEPNKKEGGVIYPIGGNYYSDTPNGPAQYVKSESVVREVFENQNEKFIGLLFEETVTKQLPGGDEIRVTPIDVEDQPEATQKADAEDVTTEAPESFKAALSSTAGKKGEEFIAKKKKDLSKLVTQMLTDGKLNLIGEDGKPISIEEDVLQSLVEKVFNGEDLSDGEKETFNQVFKFVTTVSGDVKIYVANKIAGRHPQQGYKSIELKKKNVAMGEAVRAFALKNGLNVGRSSEGAIGKKVLNPKKMASSVNPDEPEMMVEISTTKNGVNIGGKEFKRFKEIDEESLTQQLVKQGFTQQEAAKKARLLALQTMAYNQKLGDLAKIGEESGGKIPMANFGDVTNPEGRKQTANNIIDGAIKRFTTELEEYGKMFGKENLPDTPENKKVFDTLNKLKELNTNSDLENDETAREEYKKLLNQLLVDMGNSRDFKDAVADFAEIKAGLQFLSEGKQVYFPASENFQTADIIVMPDEFNVKPKDGQTMEEAIAENLQFYAVTVTFVGGLSVKYKGGGGSANYSKILQTVYKNPETQEKLLGIQSIYSLAYPKDKKGQLNIKKEDIAAAEKSLNDTIDWAIKNNIITQEEADKIRLIGQKQAKNTLSGALKNVAMCEGADREAFEQAVLLHHTMLHLTAVINNRDMLYTRFSNFNEEVSQNKEGVVTKVRDDIADGVSKPCFMNPHHNPGFDTSDPDENDCVTAAPTNQNPSHIESEPPKNLLLLK